MRPYAVNQLLERALEGRHLLDHPYYQRWEAGELSLADLGEYARQYGYFEACLPEVLAAVAPRLADETARGFVEANLADELGVPAPHLELFADFAAAVGAPEAAPTPATEALVSTYREAANGDPAAALAVIAAYEVQAAEVAATKAGALRAHYDLDERATRFWDVHATVETDHADWSLAAIASTDDSEGEAVGAAARRSADAWWAFLDERELACASVSR